MQHRHGAHEVQKAHRNPRSWVGGVYGQASGVSSYSTCTHSFISLMTSLCSFIRSCMRTIHSLTCLPWGQVHIALQNACMTSCFGSQRTSSCMFVYELLHSIRPAFGAS